MKTMICVLLTAAGLCLVPGESQAQQRFVYRPHYLYERQLNPSRNPTNDAYFLRKYGRLPASPGYVAPPAYAAPPAPLPRGVRWSDTYVPGYGFVPTDLILD